MDTSPLPATFRRSLAALLAVLLVASLGVLPRNAHAAAGGPVPGFTDVEARSAHAPAIAAVAAAGITSGCAPARFCPADQLTRAQMASLMSRVLQLAPVTAGSFRDVSTTSPHRGNINALAARGIVHGCNTSEFCPGRAVSRAQVASVVARAFGLQPTGEHPGFRDMRGSVHARSILALADAGVTLGCGDGRFCGNAPVTRAQFASLLFRAAEEQITTMSKENGKGGGKGLVKDGNKGGNTTEPVVEEPVVEPTPEPTPEPVVEEPVVEPTPEPTPEPVVEEPVVEEPVVEPTPEPVVEEPVVEEPVADPILVGALTRTSVGAPTPAGALSYDAGTYRLSGAGADIWNGSDSFEYAHRSVTGDTSVVVQVTEQSRTNAWAKAGLMVRTDTSASSAHVSLFQTPDNGLALQYRSSTGGATLHISGGAASAPTWLRLDREGNTFTAYGSEDGTNWRKLGAVTAAVATTALVGLAVTSHLDGTLSNAAFSGLNVGPVPAPAPAPAPAPVGTAFAALLSEDELAVQRQRMTNGPFRTAGDFSANSPGHWNEMAATMNLNFSSARWQGPTGIDSTGRITTGGTNNDPPGNVRQMAHDMMSAAYAAAITNNHTVAAAITKEIEYQATRPNLNYSNRTLWPFNYYNDLNPLFMHTVWVKDYVLAYDITKAMGHSSPIVERWFLDLAELNEQIVHENLSRVFPNRKSNSYASRASFVDSTLLSSTRTADGKVVEYPRIMHFYNNRRSNQAGFYGLVGVVLDNTRYKEEFKRYGREWLMFGHRVTSSDGLNGDTNRGTDSFPQLGFSYGLHAMESLIPAMDGLARQGDTSLYEFSSSDGAATPSGGTKHYKTMEGVLDTYIRWIKGSYPAQYTGSGDPPSTSITGNAFYRIQSRNTGNGREIVNDASLLLPANYYNRTDWHDVIMRKGTPTGFSAVPQNVGSIGGWRSDWRHRFLRSLDTDPYPTSR